MDVLGGRRKTDPAGTGSSFLRPSTIADG